MWIFLLLGHFEWLFHYTIFIGFEQRHQRLRSRSRSPVVPRTRRTARSVTNRRSNDQRGRAEFGPPVTPEFAPGQGITPEQAEFGLPILEVTQKMVTDQEICTICQHEFVLGLFDATILPCDHLFHFECVRDWLRRCVRCPVCNSEDI